MQHTHYFWSAHSCVNWYLAASGTYLPWGTPCLGSVLTEMATLLVSIPRGYCAPCSYCVCDSWSAYYSCFICGSYYACDSYYAACSCCVPCPVLIAWLCHAWSSNIPGHGLHALHVGYILRWGHCQDQPVEGSWPVCIVFHHCSPLSFGHCLVQMLRVQVVLVVVYGPVQLGQAPKLHLDDGVEAAE